MSISLGDKLAPYYSKKFGEVLYSGTLALEAALIASGITKGHKVILQDNVCYRILMSIVRLGAVPIIINPKNGLILSPEDILEAVEKYKPKVLILVHNYGIPANVGLFKRMFKNKFIIIEDASQTWKLKYNNYPVGTHSDFVITSFGHTKPIKLGIGGAIFSNKPHFKKYLDFNNKASRLNKDSILPYVLPEDFEINTPKLLKDGTSIFNDTQKKARLLIKELVNISGMRTWKLEKGDVATWHRFPIFSDSLKEFDYAISKAKQNNVSYELPFKIEMNAIPMSKKYNSIVINNNKIEKYQFNLILTKNSISNLKIWLHELKNLKK